MVVKRGAAAKAKLIFVPAIDPEELAARKPRIKKPSRPMRSGPSLPAVAAPAAAGAAPV